MPSFLQPSGSRVGQQPYKARERKVRESKGVHLRVHLRRTLHRAGVAYSPLF